MDKIILTDLRIDAVIGIWDWEKRNPQTISIDLEMQTDTKKVSQSDSIEDVLDYKAVSKRVKQFIQASQFNLIETLAENVAKIILEEFDVQWLKLRISKPFAIRDSRNVGVSIERTKDG
ncbi:MAG TPA: dihydroneopterin aldolase [Gammaproteobacteria bacterium]|nr:dihydroneopterin aldolase [Gammaproteobacteria bacterium]